MRLPILFIAALTVLPVLAQFDLATTQDGSVLYFGAIPPANGPGEQIFRWSKDAGVTSFPSTAQIWSRPLSTGLPVSTPRS